jgi:exodeoxyribonuclease III
MKIATWNVNSIKAHIDSAKAWLAEAQPDVVCLQEIKCETDAFPAEQFSDLGYQCAVHGQKTYNGVAILSRHKLENVVKGLPGNSDDEQARYIQATVFAPHAITVGCLYLPNGNPAPGPKYDYKLAWMERLRLHARELAKLEERTILLGDYNVIPSPADARHPDNWLTDALYLPATRDAFTTLQNDGWLDAFRALHPRTTDAYSFWDYQAGAWQKNNGIRIDHLMLSPQAADDLESAGIDKHVRGWEKPSDHVPAWVKLRV